MLLEQRAELRQGFCMANANLPLEGIRMASQFLLQ